MQGSAIRKRRVRLFELFLLALFLATALFAAFDWSDFSVAPGVSVRYVSYGSTDGVTISGALFAPSAPGEALPGVVVVHGLTDYKEELNRLSVELARRGFVVLAIDLRDHGMSDGASTFGLPTAEPEDVARGVAFLKGQPGVDPNRMAIVGHSFGGMVALIAASQPATQVNATVTWAAPINLTSLARDNFATVAFVVDKRVLPPNLVEPEQLRVRSPVEYIGGIPGLRPNSTLFLHSADDTLIPVNQSEEAYNATLGRGQTVDIVNGAGHAMATLEVLDTTIGFIEMKTKSRVSDPLDPVYPSFARDREWLTLALTMAAWPVAWLSWEFFCTRSPQPVRLYNFPADKGRQKGLVFMGADIAAFGGAVAGVSFLVVPGSAAAPFAGTLPAPSLFSGLLAAGLVLCAAAYGLARAERWARGRDDQRFEEGESLSRSVMTVVPVLLLIPLTWAFQYLLFFGANGPRSLTFALPVAVLLIMMFGFEAFLRLRVQRRMCGFLASMLPREGLRRSAVNVLVGTLLYFVMVTWVVVWLFKGYAEAPGDAALFTVGVGVVSSLLYDRTKSIVPGAVISGAYVAWVLNAPFHF